LRIDYVVFFVQRVLRFLPKKRWKRIVLAAFIIAIIVIASLLAYAYAVINTEVVSDINIVNVAGARNALVIYQPAITEFPVDVARAFADGLALNNWRVEIVTASTQAPSNISNYDLLAIVFPIYASSVPAPITRYIDRVGNLQEISTVIIGCGAMGPGDTITALSDKVQAANGNVNQTIALYTLAPNPGTGTPTDIARQAGRNIIP